MKRFKIIFTILCCVLCVQNCIGATIVAYADEVRKENDALSTFLREEMGKDTHNLDESVERELNSKGIFDEEIERFDNDLINDLEEADVISVKNEYIAVNESGEYYNMDREMVNEIIDEKYIKNKDKCSKNFLENVLESVGIIPITTYAAAKSNISSGEYLKKSIIIIQPKGGIYTAHVTITFTWLKEPSNRCIDIPVVYFAGADIVDNSKASCIYYYKVTSKVYDDGILKTVCVNEEDKKSYTTNMKSYWCIDTGNASYAYALVDLCDDFIYRKAGQWYTDHMIIMQMDVKKDEHDTDNAFTPQVRYYHQKSSINISPSVSIEVGGKASFSGGVAFSNNFYPTGETLNITYNWK